MTRASQAASKDTKPLTTRSLSSAPLLPGASPCREANHKMSHARHVTKAKGRLAWKGTVSRLSRR